MCIATMLLASVISRCSALLDFAFPRAACHRLCPTLHAVCAHFSVRSCLGRVAPPHAGLLPRTTLFYLSGFRRPSSPAPCPPHRPLARPLAPLFCVRFFLSLWSPPFHQLTFSSRTRPGSPGLCTPPSCAAFAPSPCYPGPPVAFSCVAFSL